jgi:hypothetical protein
VTDVGRSSEVSKLSVHGPIDFVLIEFEGSRPTGHADDRIGDFAKLGRAQSDLLTEDDMAEAGAAALVVAGARIPAQHGMDTLENLEIWN